MGGRGQSAGGRGRGRGSPTGQSYVSEKSGGGGFGQCRAKNGDPKFPMDMAEWSDTGQTGERYKRQRYNTGGDGAVTEVILTEFDTLSVDDKLSTMMRKLVQIDDIRESLTDMKVRMDSSMAEIQVVNDRVESIDHRLKYVEYRAIDLEARSRRNNLVFFGISEDKDEVCEDVVRDFLADKMGISKAIDFFVQRAHRIGRRIQATRGFKPRPRPIIVALRDFADIDMIMRSVGALKGTGMGVTRDFPSEVNEARKRLMPEFKQAKARNLAPKIIFPAKLTVDNRVVRVEFPDWNPVLYRRGGFVDTGPRDAESSSTITTSGEHSSAGEVDGAMAARGTTDNKGGGRGSDNSAD